MYGLPVQRRKLTTYGKTARQPTYNLSREEALQEKAHVTPSWQAEVRRPSVEQTPKPSAAIGTPVRQEAGKKKETSWDVPSSGDETTRGPATSTRPTKSSHLPKSAKKLPDQTHKKKEADTNWDFPLSDEESETRARPTRSSQPPEARTELRTKILQSGFGGGSRETVSDKERKRKRERSTSQARPAPRQKSVPPLAAPAELTSKHSIPPAVSVLPSRKRQKTPSKVSPPKNAVSHRTRSRTTTPEPLRVYGKATTKPKRADQSLKVSQRHVDKSSSAPAALFDMIREADSPPTDSSDNFTAPPTPKFHHEMDIDDLPSTPPLRTTTSHRSVMKSGSVTPRQKELWGKLLDSDPVDVPSDFPPISKLQLSSSRKPLALSRSSSDVPQTTHARRIRLIDSLKASAPIEEEDEDMDDIDESEFAEERPIGLAPPQTPLKTPKLPPPVKASTGTTTMKITYAQQRSYLAPKDDEAAFDELVEEFSQSTALQTSQSHYQDPEDEDEDDGQGIARGFHDLRAAGSNLRLSDMFDNLINDIEGKSNPLSIQRSALIELSTKLMDQTAATYFLDRGFDRRLVKAVNETVDVTSNFIIAAATSILAANGASLTALRAIRNSKWYTNAIQMLSIDVDISKVVRDRRNNLSKIAQSTVLEFKDAVLKSKIWEGAPATSLSPRLAALKSLELLVRKMREHGSLDILLDEETISSLLTIATTQIEKGDSDTTAVELVLSTLESSTTTPATQKKKSGWPTMLVRSMALCLPSLVSISKPFGSQRCGDLALRLSLNLTNENVQACDAYGTATVIQPLVEAIIHLFGVLTKGLGTEEQTMALDRLTLCLGVMINLAEFSDKVRYSVIDGNEQLLDQAVQLFLAGREKTGQADSIEDMQTNVPYGYLAILLGNLSQNDRVRKRVQKKLPGGNLGVLVNAVDEFTKIHQIADRDMFDGEEGKEVYTNFTARLQVVGDNLRRVTVAA